MRALAVALVLVGLLTAAASAAMAPERLSRGPRPALVSNESGKEVKSELGTYCVSGSGGGRNVGQCVDALPPAIPPTPRLGLSRAGRVEVRFRHARGLDDEVTGFSASLARLGGERGFVTIELPMKPRRIEATQRRWEFLLPADLHRANALVIFAALESGDAMFTVGLRRVADPAAPIICPATGGDAFDTEELVGLTVEEAEAVAGRHRCNVRIGELDGEPQAGTSDYRTDRVNVAVVAGRVDRIIGIG